MADKDELWDQIGKEVWRDRRRRVRVYAAVAAGLVIVLALLILIVDLTGTEGEDIDTISDEVDAFTPICIEECTREEILENAHPIVRHLIPENMPAQFVYREGEYDQDKDSISIQFIYNNLAIDEGLLFIYCRYFGKNSNVVGDMSISMDDAELHTEE